MTVFSHDGRVYFWDRKENLGQRGISLSELLLFFKVKQFNDLRDISASYEEFEHWNSRVKTILRSFVDFPANFPDDDPWRCVPRRIAEAYNESREEVLLDSMRWARSLLSNEDWWDDILDFFDDRFCGHVLEKMDYALKTPSGDQGVSLIFAENFRFKIDQGSFNIFNMTKVERDAVIPQDEQSLIFAADFRQFEFRTFLKLQGMDKYFDDDNLYQTIGKDLGMNVEDVKVGVISSLYGSKRDEKLERFFRRDELLSKIDGNIFWSDEGPVYVPEHHEKGKKVHTIVQTVSQYVYLRKLDKVLRMLHNKKSRFIFPLHDSVIISLRRDEPEVLDDVLDILEDKTYKIKCYMGSNFRDALEI